MINSLCSCGYEGAEDLVRDRPGNLNETQACTYTYLPNLGGKGKAGVERVDAAQALS